MSKHTPGPWNGGREAINDAKGRLLANVYFKGVSGSIPVEEGHANARLIASAPAMYEVLKGVLETLDDRGTVERGGMVHEWLKEALAKAERGASSEGAA